MQEQYTTTVNVRGKGESKARAFADALSQVQSQVLKPCQKVLLRIEPVGVEVLAATQQVRKEKFLFLFLARERHLYQVQLRITVNVTAIDPGQVEFTSI